MSSDKAPRAWHKEEKKMCPVWSLTWKDGKLKYVGYEEKDDEGDVNKFTGNADEFVLLKPTGLPDKNGKEIYEGDICRQTFNHKTNTGEVRLSPTQGCLVGLYPLWPHDIEIIGDKFQNPNLLGKKE